MSDTGMEWLRDADAARMGCDFARQDVGAGRRADRAEVLARLSYEAVEMQVTGWAQDACFAAYELTEVGRQKAGGTQMMMAGAVARTCRVP